MLLSLIQKLWKRRKLTVFLHWLPSLIFQYIFLPTSVCFRKLYETKKYWNVKKGKEMQDEEALIRIRIAKHQICNPSSFFKNLGNNQCCGSESGRIGIILVDLDPSSIFMSTKCKAKLSFFPKDFNLPSKILFPTCLKLGEWSTTEVIIITYLDSYSASQWRRPVAANDLVWTLK
jgi:hypothetical protein